MFHGYSQMGALRDAAVAACQPFDFVLSPVSPVPTFPAEWASPLNDPQRPFEHIAFTLPYNMSEQPAASHQLRLHARRACRSACRSPAAATTTSACCSWPRPGSSCAPPQRPWPQPPAADAGSRYIRAMTSPDPRGNPCGTRIAAARDAAETALWRMMSFYDTPLADLDAAIAADPGWALPHVMRPASCSA